MESEENEYAPGGKLIGEFENGNIMSRNYDAKKINENGNKISPEFQSLGKPLDLTNSPVSTKTKQINKDLNNIYFSICKRYKFSIYKPLIPLKVVLFCYYGAGSFLTPFITVYFKQRGITLAELSTTYIIAPIAQFLGTLLSGVIADKIGKSKPVLVANLVITALVIASILSVPYPDNIECNKLEQRVTCSSYYLNSNGWNASCNTRVTITMDKGSCDIQCANHFTSECQRNISDSSASARNVSVNFNRGESSELDSCSYNQSFQCRCNSTNDFKCDIKCSELNCFHSDHKEILNIITMVLYVCLMVVYSNCYRFLDVTAMYLVKEHDSDFGRERFFSIAGALVISPIAGYLVKSTTAENNQDNYASALYLFIAIIIFILIIVYKLDVRINPPGKKMVKKSAKLLKNPDVLSFALVVFVLGTAWSFTTKFLFWYLKEFEIPSILIGLIPAAGALYGLPFLFTSDWWMKKIGTTKMFILGLFGYTIYCIGYAFLVDPWISLVLEAFNIVTYHLLWVAVVLRSNEIAPEGLSATVISVAGSIHYHIGKSSGSMIGGFVMSNYSGRTAFLVVAAMCFICAIIYIVYLSCRQRFCKANIKV